jgi:uncharacterized protein (DUF488 family)
MSIVEEVTLFTIGMVKKPAAKFFGMLDKAGVQRVIDIRLNNTSQLAGFTKRDDLRFFLKAVSGIGYLHVPECAPTKEILEEFRKKGSLWQAYEKKFLALISERGIENVLTREVAHKGCLLCSEETPEFCHRRLVAEYLADKWKHVKIVHLV